MSLTMSISDQIMEYIEIMHEQVSANMCFVKYSNLH